MQMISIITRFLNEYSHLPLVFPYDVLYYDRIDGLYTLKFDGSLDLSSTGRLEVL